MLSRQERNGAVILAAVCLLTAAASFLAGRCTRTAPPTEIEINALPADTVHPSVAGSNGRQKKGEQGENKGKETNKGNKGKKKRKETGESESAPRARDHVAEPIPSGGFRD